MWLEQGAFYLIAGGSMVCLMDGVLGILHNSTVGVQPGWGNRALQK